MVNKCIIEACRSDLSRGGSRNLFRKGVSKLITSVKLIADSAMPDN